MYREFYSALPSTAWPIAVMGFFLVAFAVVLLRTFVFHRRRDFDDVAAMPFADDPETLSDSDRSDSASHEVTR